jgi:tetratricopeptide (TPR) repeat protein
LALLGRTSLDTRQVPRLFQLLRAQSEAPPVPIYLSDHPALAEREKYTEAAIQGQPPQGRDGTESGEYLGAFSKAILDDVQGEIDARRFRTAILRAKSLADWRAEGPHYYWLAEAYRNLGPRSQDPSPAEAGKEPLARLRLTVSDENQLLERQPEGKERLRESESMAEATYQRAIALGFGRAHRGIGLLYQRQSRLTEARDAYSRYLESVPDASDKAAIQRRIVDLANK